jgi:hypothetical protein
MHFKSEKIDRETYPYKATWIRPSDDINETIHFYYVENRSYSMRYEQNVQTIKANAVIAVRGNHKFAQKDTIKFEDGLELKIYGNVIEVHQQMNNALIHAIKPKVVEQVLTLR